MVKLPSLCLAALAAVLPVAMANDCVAGLIYCGSTLLRYGNYEQRIANAIGQIPIGYFNYKERSLFQCVGGGNIQYLKTCSLNCVDGGAGRNDGCFM
ncbi:hypothetical protein E4U53_003965 [Claviceps sorghi]|nr:hypothetical protein E4U53_003965 [Claviceps sorghi]